MFTITIAIYLKMNSLILYKKFVYISPLFIMRGKLKVWNEVQFFKISKFLVLNIFYVEFGAIIGNLSTLGRNMLMISEANSPQLCGLKSRIGGLKTNSPAT